MQIQRLCELIVRQLLGLGDKWLDGFTRFQYEVGWLRGRNRIGERTRGPIGPWSHPDAETSFPSVPPAVRDIFIPLMAAMKLLWWCSLGREGIEKLRSFAGKTVYDVDAAELLAFNKRHHAAWMAARALVEALGLPLAQHFTAAEHNTLVQLLTYVRGVQALQEQGVDLSQAFPELPAEHQKLLEALAKGKETDLIALDNAQVFADAGLLTELVEDDLAELLDAADRFAAC